MLYMLMYDVKLERRRKRMQWTTMHKTENGFEHSGMKEICYNLNLFRHHSIE